MKYFECCFSLLAHFRVFCIVYIYTLLILFFLLFFDLQLQRRRRKLTTPVYFPSTLGASELSGSSDIDSSSALKYDLTGVVLHSGTALGGHYRSFLRTNSDNNDNIWIDCNDANVTQLSADDVANMFADSVTSSSTCAGGKGSFVHDNAYMLIYKVSSSSGATTTAASIAPDIRAEIDAENEAFAVKLRLLEIKQHVVELTVCLRPVDSDATAADSAGIKKVHVILSNSTTVELALQSVHKQFTESKLLDAVYPLAQCRLRKYLNNSNVPISSTAVLGETFGDRPHLTLLQCLGLTSSATLALEVRKSGDVEFVEFNPKDMNLTLSVWKTPEDGEFFCFTVIQCFRFSYFLFWNFTLTCE